ncbi:MAG: hypothetical protein WCJ64_05885 [Rhodospirillaceae bacterium]
MPECNQIKASNDNKDAPVDENEFFEIYSPVFYDDDSTLLFTKSLMTYVASPPGYDGTETSAERINEIQNIGYDLRKGDFWRFGWTRHEAERFDEISQLLGHNFRSYKATNFEGRAVSSARRMLSRLQLFATEAGIDSNSWFPGEHIILEAGIFYCSLFRVASFNLVIGLNGEVSRLADRLGYTFNAVSKYGRSHLP